MKEKGNKILLAIPAVIFCADGIVKHLIDRKMKPDEPKEIFGGRLILQKHYNKGALLGILASKPRAVVLLQGIFLSAAVMCYAALFSQKGKTGLKISFGMFLGGGLCNLYDRFRKQHVVDYIKIPVKSKRLSKVIFNISDIFIFAGAVLTAFLGDSEREE